MGLLSRIDGCGYQLMSFLEGWCSRFVVALRDFMRRPVRS